MLALVDGALTRGGMTRAELENLRARMRRYSREVDALGTLASRLARGLDALCPPAAGR